MKPIEKLEEIFASGKIFTSALVGLAIMLPILAFMLAPFVIWAVLPTDTRDSASYAWLREATWIWPLCWFGVTFLSLIGWAIYNGVKDSKR